jgi:hypothetical protein
MIRDDQRQKRSQSLKSHRLIIVTAMATTLMLAAALGSLPQLACTTPGGASEIHVPQPPLAMTIALYTEPGPKWKRMAAAAKVHRGVPMTAIISPHHNNNKPPEAGDNIEKYLAHNATWLNGLAELDEGGTVIDCTPRPTVFNIKNRRGMAAIDVQ